MNKLITITSIAALALMAGTAQASTPMPADYANCALLSYHVHKNEQRMQEIGNLYLKTRFTESMFISAVREVQKRIADIDPYIFAAWEREAIESCKKLGYTGKK